MLGGRSLKNCYIRLIVREVLFRDAVEFYCGDSGASG